MNVFSALLDSNMNVFGQVLLTSARKHFRIPSPSPLASYPKERVSDHDIRAVYLWKALIERLIIVLTFQETPPKFPQ